MNTVPVSRRPSDFLAMGSISESLTQIGFSVVSLSLLYHAAPDELRTKYIHIGDMMGQKGSSIFTSSPRPGFSDLDVEAIVVSVQQLESMSLGGYSSEFGYVPL